MYRILACLLCVVGPVGVFAYDSESAELAGRLAALRRTVEREPTNARAHHELGDALGQALQRSGLLGKLSLVRQCKAALERAVELAPESVDYRRSLMGFYRHAPGVLGGGMARAREQAEHIARIDPVLGSLSRGELAVVDGRFEEARRELGHVLEKHPDNAPALYQLGLIPLLERRDPSSGIAALRKFVALPTSKQDPQYWAAWWHLGMLHEMQGEVAEALGAYARAAEANPQEPRVAESQRKLEEKHKRSR